VPAKTVLGLSSDAWVAIASLINAVSVVVLVLVTLWYARSAKRQAISAEAQAAAAGEQARATRETLREQLNQRNTTVRIAFSMTQKNAERWKQEMSEAGFPQVPADIELLPTNYQTVLELAAQIDHMLYHYLSIAFDKVGSAEIKLKLLREANFEFPNVWQPRKVEVLFVLDEALNCFQIAATHLPQNSLSQTSTGDFLA
jgi:hypothetical protein